MKRYQVFQLFDPRGIYQLDAPNLLGEYDTSLEAGDRAQKHYEATVPEAVRLSWSSYGAPRNTWYGNPYTLGTQTTAPINLYSIVEIEKDDTE